MRCVSIITTKAILIHNAFLDGSTANRYRSIDPWVKPRRLDWMPWFNRFLHACRCLFHATILDRIVACRSSKQLAGIQFDLCNLSLSAPDRSHAVVKEEEEEEAVADWQHACTHRPVPLPWVCSFVALNSSVVVVTASACICLPLPPLAV